MAGGADMLDAIIGRLNSLPEPEQEQIKARAREYASSRGMIWLPNPGPQTDAYLSRADILLYGGQGGGGKALALDTPIMTADGLRQMGDIRVGDTVLNEYARPVRVVRVSQVMVGEECWRLRFSDGSHIVSDARHTWRTSTRRDRSEAVKNGTPIALNWQLVTTARIAETLIVEMSPNHVIYVPSPTRGYLSARPVMIVGAEPVESVPVRCIEVDGSSHLYLVGATGIPTHNSDLGLGLAFTGYQTSLILRRKYADLGALTDRAIKINGTRQGYNGQSPPTLRTIAGRVIHFGANQHAGDEEAWQGRAFPYKYFDEAVQFLEMQVRFHLGWVRQADDYKGEPVHTRAVLGSNPPTDASGDWLIGMFRPWLDITYHNPAAHGELRYFITVSAGKRVEDIEVDEADVGTDEHGRRVIQRNGERLFVLSRTFIPAALGDNPFLVNTNYQAQLDALPEPIRSAVRDGNFMAGRVDAERQVIPTQWVLEAQSRWTPDGGRHQPMSAMGYDPAGGGKDSAELAVRHGGWYGQLVSETGPGTADGRKCAGTITAHRRNGAPIVVDCGGGYGGQVTLILKENETPYVSYNGAGASTARTKDGSLKFANKRAEVMWKFREALDPEQEGGSPIELPPDPILTADLTAATFEVRTGGILIESKDEIRTRIGRSPGRGDAVVMAYSEGDKALLRMARASENKRRLMIDRQQESRGVGAIRSRFGSRQPAGRIGFRSGSGEQG